MAVTTMLPAGLGSLAGLHPSLVERLTGNAGVPRGRDPRCRGSPETSTIDRIELASRGSSKAGSLLPTLPRSRHLPRASTDGSSTENLNEIGVRLWTACSAPKAWSSWAQEMSEWLKEHAWKAARWSNAETYRSTFSAAASTT